MADLIVMDDFRSWASRSGIGELDRLENLISGVSLMAERFIGRTLTITTYTDELYSMRNPERGLVLKQYPMTAVPTSVKIDDDALTVADDIDAELAAGVLYRVGGGYWPRGFRHIKVSYPAGLVTLPATPAPQDLINALCEQIAYEALNTGNKGRRGSKRTVLESGATEEFITQDFAPGVKKTLNRYKRVSIH